MGGDSQQCCYREQIAYSFFTKFREPKLYKLAQSGAWDEIPERCQTLPKEAEFQHKYAPNDTPLHRLLRAVESESCLELDDATRTELGALKLTAVEAILAASRVTTAQKDAFGRTPLHYAAMNVQTSAGDETLAAILHANPAAAAIADHEGRTPLSYLLARNDVISTHVLELLIQACPQAVEMADLVKETPLDIVKRRRDEVENSSTLLKILSVSSNLPLATSGTVGLET